jgi:putative DNA-invertase from lambdoid prophage Rac
MPKRQATDFKEATKGPAGPRPRPKPRQPSPPNGPVSTISASPPSLSAIAKAEGLTKQTVFRIKTDPRAAEAALVAWGL